MKIRFTRSILTVLFISICCFLTIAGRTQASSIEGTVTYNDLSPSDFVFVRAYDSNGKVRVVAVDSSSGVYIFEGLPAGTYTLFFWAFKTEYISTWYDGSTDSTGGALSRNDALSIEITADDITNNTTKSGKDIQLTRGGTISGTVTYYSDDSSVEGALVLVFDSLDSEEQRGFAYTDTEGVYTVKGLPLDGSVKVQFFERKEADGTGGGLTEWYDNKISFNIAGTVTTGDTLIDAVLGDPVERGDFNWWLFTPALTHRPTP